MLEAAHEAELWQDSSCAPLPPSYRYPGPEELVGMVEAALAQLGVTHAVLLGVGGLDTIYTVQLGNKRNKKAFEKRAMRRYSIPISYKAGIPGGCGGPPGPEPGCPLP